jgi:hypothetical protein
MKRYLRVKAGHKAFALVKEEGIRPERIGCFAGPAGGPKWFTSVGFDRALIRFKFLQRSGRRVLLAGSSAGAWRCLAMSCKDPLLAYERLRIAYSRNIFTESDTQRTVSLALKRNVDAYLKDDDVEFILHHPHFDLALHTVRARGPAAMDNRFVQGAALIMAGLCNIASPRGTGVFFERVVFFSGEQPPGFLASGFQGRSAPLTSANLRRVALATGSLPFIVQGVRCVPDAPPGVYRDGGLRDYQLNERYLLDDDKITLFFHYQQRIIPGWFDKKLWWRAPRREAIENVVQIFPAEDFVRLLPDGRIPDRDDFIRFMDAPLERIKRWDRVSELSDILGEEFMELVESGRVKSLVEPLT